MNHNYPDDFTEAEKEFSRLLQEAASDGLIQYPQTSYADFLKRVEERELARKKQRRSRFLHIACIFLIVFLSSSGIALWLVSDSAMAAKFGWDKFLHKTKSGELTTNQDGSADEGSIEVKYTSLDEIEQAKKFLPQLLVPEYIPEGYEFESLRIMKQENGCFEANYIFTVPDSQCYIDINGGLDSDSDLYIYGITEDNIETEKVFFTVTEVSRTEIA